MSIMAKRVLHLILLAIFSIGVIGILLFSLSPDVLIGEKEHHFGVVQIERPNETLMHTFYLQNNTNHPLQLKDAIPSCGCTTVEFNNEMVDPGETFELPVTLDLQRSRYRSAKVRLEFESGEVEVLLIDAFARFKQPLKCMPPTIQVAQGDKEGTQCVLAFECFKPGVPLNPTFKTPASVVVEMDHWHRSNQSDNNRGTPNDWTVPFTINLDGDLPKNSTLDIKIGDFPVLQVPLVLVDKVQRPRFIPSKP